MTLLMKERFQRDLRSLSKAEKARCFELLLVLPKAVGQPHEHSGIGLRKIHKSGVWEARVGLGLRVVFAMKADQIILATIGSHDHVRKYLSSL